MNNYKDKFNNVIEEILYFSDNLNNNHSKLLFIIYSEYYELNNI